MWITFLMLKKTATSVRGDGFFLFKTTTWLRRSGSFYYLWAKGIYIITQFFFPFLAAAVSGE
jgi:hypothetical protein